MHSVDKLHEQRLSCKEANSKYTELGNRDQKREQGKDKTVFGLKFLKGLDKFTNTVF